METAMLVSRFNEHTIYEYKALMNDFGVGRAIASRLQLNPQLSFYWLPTPSAFRHENYLQDSIMPKSCNWHYNSISINWDGRVSPFCLAYDKAADFALINEYSYIIEIWNNENYRSARNVFNHKLEEKETICTIL